MESGRGNAVDLHVTRDLLRDLLQQRLGDSLRRLRLHVLHRHELDNLPFIIASAPTSRAAYIDPT